MASVSFKITSSSKFKAPDENTEVSEQTSSDVLYPAYVNGQIIFVQNTSGNSKIYLDMSNHRRCYTPESSGGGSADPNAMRYKGISTSDPTTGTVTIGGQTYTPSLNDVVVYQDKEYLYREDDDGRYGWFELGDENRPTGEIMWDVDED